MPDSRPKKQDWTTPVKHKYLLIPWSNIKETDEGQSNLKTLVVESPEKIVELELSDEEVQSMKPESFQELMTCKEVAQYLRIPMPTVYYLLGRGQLPGVQIGGRWRIKKSLLDSDVLQLIHTTDAS